MSNPQIEDGYTRIANELFEEILRFPFTKREQTIVFAVIRKTYGYNKKADEISLSQLAEITGISKPHISETVTKLVTLNVLLVEQGKFAQRIELNKKYKQWVTKTVTVTKSVTKGYQNGNLKVTKSVTTKDKSKYKPKDIYTTDFLNAWEHYPKRNGSNDKRKAFKAWSARLTQGHTTDVMIQGAQRYNAYCVAIGRVGTEFVMQAATFFGPADPPHFLEPWASAKKQEDKPQRSHASHQLWRPE